MDEAVRCHRIGFMGKGRLIAEGTPGELRSSLNDRILELRGSPLPLLKQIAAQDSDVEDVGAFGDRLHIRLKEKNSDAVIRRLQHAIPAAGGLFLDARSVAPGLEDVFIALTRQKD
jgi:ABC-type multidrug transport system ATPase subunit